MWLSCDACIARVEDELRWAVSNLAVMQTEISLQEKHHATVTILVAVVPWAQHHHALMFQTLRGVMWSACSLSAHQALGEHGSGLQAATQHGSTLHYTQHTQTKPAVGKPSLFTCAICAGMQAHGVGVARQLALAGQAAATAGCKAHCQQEGPHTGAELCVLLTWARHTILARLGQPLCCAEGHAARVGDCGVRLGPNRRLQQDTQGCSQHGGTTGVNGLHDRHSASKIQVFV